jgi:cytochrome c oxidase accessory protein FixG
MVSAGLGVALVTALFGRAFCGWGCPHTLFMEFVIRPIERLTKARPNAKSTTAGMAAKYLLFLISAWVLGNTILAYFIGGSTIRTWMTQSPLQHPWPFVATAAMTAAFFFHVAYFREQLCLLACPYGRFQSALLDKQSLIVAYDVNRGEPRGKRRPGVYSLEVLGDCIDCGACTRTCPTGIDIRNGLQMECVNCTQCIDACDAMMTKVGRPTGLVRYASAAGMEGRPNRLLRPRTLLYPAALAVSLSLFFCVLFTRTSFDAVVFRAAGAPFVMAGDGRVHNTLRIKLVNRHDEPTEFRLESTTPGTTLSSATMPHRVDPGVTFEAAVEVSADKDGFQNGGRDLGIAVTNSRNERRTLTWRMIGPR